MKLWLLRPLEKYWDDAEGSCQIKPNPWCPWYNKAFGYVIRAESETEARQIAAEEGNDHDLAPAWLNSEFSSCALLTPEGERGIVITDFNAA